MEQLAIIDPRLPEAIVLNLRKEGFKTIPVTLTELVDPPLSGHPDIQMFLHDKNLFVHPAIDPGFIRSVEKYVNIIKCRTPLGADYPEDIPYNIACTGSIAFHKKKSMDESILNYLQNNLIEIVEVKQGYTKCSTMIVDDSSIVTPDISIHTAAERAGLNSLLIEPGHVDLPGYKYGFIGGASGRFHDTLYLTGSIKDHPDKDRITGFIESKNIRIKILSDHRLFDAGSIFFIG